MAAMTATNEIVVPDTPMQIRGRIVHVFKADTNWSAGRIKTVAHGTMSFTAPFRATVGNEITLTGYEINDSKWGKQFKASKVDIHMPVTSEGIARYIANHPDFKNIGEIRAEKIAKVGLEIGNGNFEYTLTYLVDELAEKTNINIEIIKTLAFAWNENAAINGIMTALSAYELTYNQCKKLVDKWGNNAMAIIKNNPYCMIPLIDGFGFSRVDKIALKLGTGKDSYERIKAGILHLLNNETDLNGHIWTKKSDLLHKAGEMLALDRFDAPIYIENVLIDMTEPPDYAKYPDIVIVDNEKVAKYMLYDIEKNIATTLLSYPELRIMKQNCDIDDKLNDLQKLAITKSLRFPLMLLCGGAGTGKTYVINDLAAIHENQGNIIVLAAPTGKAARRLSESTGRDAMTIHKLLGYDGSNWEYNIENKLFTNHSQPVTLIIDEMSMVDSPLFWHLLQAIDIANTRLILVGDPNQLPPVGPGNVLRDLIASESIPRIMLIGIMRQAGLLRQNSHAVLQGLVPESSPATNDNVPREWILNNKLKKADLIIESITKLFDNPDQLKNKGFNPIRDVQIITPVHKGELGTIELNKLLQRIIQKKYFNFNVPLPERENSRPNFYPGDKVIQTKNDYNTGVMNGQIGTVLEDIDDDTDNHLIVEFDTDVASDPIVVKLDDNLLPKLSLAYALTAHKVQGSEFPMTIIICYRSHQWVHHRNWLYTAVTRARKTCVILGDNWGIRHAAEKIETDRRRTFLQTMLVEGID